MEAASVISVQTLTKRYGASRGVEDLTFEVAAGEAFGFLGPNGAGKTTTIRTVLDLIRPNGGTVRVFGMDPRRRRRPRCARAWDICRANSRSTNG